MSIKDKVVIITGASSGIGRACAVAFAEEGCRLSLAARNLEQLNETAALCREKLTSSPSLVSPLTTQILTIPTDVSKEEDCKNLVEKTLTAFGRIDILLNNAGISMRALFEDTDLSVLKTLMDVNFWGTVYCTKYALPELLKNTGSVIGISSIAGLKGVPARTGYSASKFAMNGFLEALRIETLKKGLHVMVVAPGFVASNIRTISLTADGSTQKESPLEEGKLMQPEEVAKAVIIGVKKRKRMLVLTSLGKLTNFLNKFFPGFMDGQVYRHMANEPNSPLKNN